MPRLTDLPDELLLQIFTCDFRFRLSRFTNYDDTPPTLHNYIINRRLFNIAWQAFFDTLTHQVTIKPDCKEWDQGTQLCDIYSPTYTRRGYFRDVWTFVTNVQNLLIVLHVDDLAHVNTAAHEALKEMRRYPKLKKVYIEVSGIRHRLICSPEEMLSTITEMVEGSAMKHVKIKLVSPDGCCS